MNNKSYFERTPKRKNKKKLPIKAITLAVSLFIFGLICLTLGILLITGVYETRHHDRGWPLITLGTITFVNSILFYIDLIFGLLQKLPGFYHVRIAWKAYNGVPGFHYDDIPEFD